MRWPYHLCGTLSPGPLLLGSAKAPLARVQFQQVARLAELCEIARVGDGLDGGSRAGPQATLLKNPFPTLRCALTVNLDPTRIDMLTFAASTNGKNALPQICNCLQRREFALDVSIELVGLNEATKLVHTGLPIGCPL